MTVESAHWPHVSGTQAPAEGPVHDFASILTRPTWWPLHSGISYHDPPMAPTKVHTTFITYSFESSFLSVSVNQRHRQEKEWASVLPH